MHLRFSQDIKLLLERLASQPLSLADIMGNRERGFNGDNITGFAFLFAGLTGPFGSGCLLAVQMALGRRSPGYPKKQFKFPRRFVLQLLQNLKRVTGARKIARPRLLKLAESPQIWRLNGVCIAWLTLLLISPIPFTNPIPTVGILLLTVATLETDGLLMCISYGVTVLITLFFDSLFMHSGKLQLIPNIF